MEDHLKAALLWEELAGPSLLAWRRTRNAINLGTPYAALTVSAQTGLQTAALRRTGR